jgi:hypothetical protein
MKCKLKEHDHWTEMEPYRRYDGILLEAGHSVVGIDQSAGMLARARERFPAARYEKMGLQEMDFRLAVTT